MICVVFFTLHYDSPTKSRIIFIIRCGFLLGCHNNIIPLRYQPMGRTYRWLRYADNLPILQSVTS